jgi:hypothetical protein
MLQPCSHEGFGLGAACNRVAAERAVSQRVSVARHEAMKYRRDIDGLRAVAIAARHFRFSPDFGYIAALRRADVQGHKQINGLHARGLYLLCNKVASECAEFWI